MGHSIDTRLSRPNLPDKGGITYGEMVIDPDSGSGNAARQIALCVDVSGSMHGEKIDSVRQGIQWVLGLLDDADHLSLVTFNSSADELLSATKMTEDQKDRVRSMVDQMSTGGGTDIQDGIRKARQTLQQLPDDDQTARRILLLTDGQDTGNFERLAEECADMGMSIMSAGIGTDYDEDVVRTLGEKSQGEWRHLEEANDIRDFFGDKVEEASTVVAANPELTLNVTTGTEVQEVYMGMPQVQPVDVDWQDNTAVIKIPDLAEGSAQKLVFKFQAPEREAGQEFLLANATLSTGSGEQNEQFAIDYTDDPDKLRVNNEDVEVAFEGTKLRNEMIEAETQVEQEQVETRIEEMEELHPDHEEVTRLEEDHQTIVEGDDPRAARDDVSRVMDDE
ncbi:vWA domain-containing protein [Halosegnis longus]|uniref:vWA domain-containing protein n=1 Tax=Halosegnis longus TaxID=2216012 RepID=UPI00096AB1A6|nr:MULTISPECIES: VWA domain-containing protein [Halobacteriales]